MLNRVWVFSIVGYAVMVAVACGKSSTGPILIPAEQGIATPTPTPAPDTFANIPAAGEFASSLSTSRAFASLLTLTNPQSLNCDSKNSGQTVYVRSDATFSYCNGSSWEAIDLHGPAGAAGSQGVTGLQGLQGAQGGQGPAGSVGSQGPQGIAGATGPTGASGPTGATGPAGSTGAQGLRGLTGDTGAKGDAGEPGDRVVGWYLKQLDGTLVGQIEDEMIEYLDGKVQGEYYLVKKDGYRTVFKKIFSSTAHTSDGKYFTGTTRLTSLSRQSVPIKAFVFTDTTCSGTPYAAINSSGSYLVCGMGPGCSWDFSNTAWVTSVFAGKNMIYSYSNSQDYIFSNDCASGSIFNQFKSTNYNGTCQFICAYNSSSWCYQDHRSAPVTGCPISIYSKVFPDSVASGYTITPGQ